MNARIITIAFVLALGLVVLPAAPALEELSITTTADAKPCIAGQDDSCIIPIVCIKDDCPSIP